MTRTTVLCLLKRFLGQSWIRDRTAIITILVLATLNLFQLLARYRGTLQFISNANPGEPINSTSIPHHRTLPDHDVVDKALVIASFKGQNVTWISRVPQDWRVYRYLSDDPTPVLRSTAYDHAHATVENPLNPHTLRTPTKNGREAIAYLTWIIDNYQNLPFFTVFMHGHERSWHMVERADDKLRALNFTDVALNGYTNIRCSETPQCLPGHGMDLSKASDTIKPRSLNFLPQFWRIIFPFDDDPPLPENLQVIGTAQFIVPREKILARPLEFWQGLRQPLTRTLKELEEMMPDLRKTDVDTSQEAQLSHVLGLVYEKIWHVVFGQPAEYCVAEDHCRSVTFAGAIECDKYIGYAEQSMGWERIKCRTDQDAMTRAALTQADAIGAAKRRLLKGED